MELDYNRAKEKEEELLSALSCFLNSKCNVKKSIDRISDEIKSVSINIRPPEKEKVIIHLMTMSASGRGGGKSIKAGNIVLNMRKLVKAIAEGTFAAISSYTYPWLGILGFILLWESLREAAQIDLSENDAVVIWTMWSLRDKENDVVSENGLLDKVNDHLSNYNRVSIVQEDIDFSLINLEKIKCIIRLKSNPVTWRLVEYISHVYR